MADWYTFTLFIITLLSLSSLPLSTRAQEMIRSPEELDLLIRDYTFRSLGSPRRIKTGEIYNVDLPANLSDGGGGITANAARFRCGSLTRYGARFDGVRLERGIRVQPCFLRVMVITQHLGVNWSSLYSSNYDLSGYQLVSPIVGLTIYDYNSSSYNPDSSNPLEIGVRSGQGNPLVTIRFSNTTADQNNPFCAIFGRNGTVSLIPPSSPRVCESTADGHYGLVVKLPPLVPPAPAPTPAGAGGGGGGGKSTTKRKVVVGVLVGAAILVAMLLVLVFVMVKKKRKIVEMERRGFEGEDLRFAVVGNVRTPVAGSTRTLPSLENEFVPRNDPSSSID